LVEAEFSKAGAVLRLTPLEYNFVYLALIRAIHEGLPERDVRYVLGLDFAEATAFLDALLTEERKALESEEHWRFIPPPDGADSPDAEGRVWTGVAWGPPSATSEKRERR
jgi:hypothetical protein